MLRKTCLAILLVLLAGACAYAQPVTPPRAALEAGILGFIPDDAMIAIRLRMAKVVTSDLWQKLLKSEELGIRKGLEEKRLNLDVEKDVTDMVLVLAIDLAEGRPSSPRFALAMELNHDASAKDFFKVPAEEMKVLGLDIAAYKVGPEQFVAFPRSRLVIMATEPQYLSHMCGGAARNPVTDALWLKALDQPGEVLLAFRMAEPIRKSLQETRKKARELLRRPGDPKSIGMFIGMDSAARLGLELQHITASLDLSQGAGVMQATVVTTSENGAAFFGSALEMLEPSLNEAQAALRQEPDKPPVPLEPLYHATFQGREARLTVSRAGLDQLISMLIPAVVSARTAAQNTASLNNLRQLVTACHTYARSHGLNYPPSLAAAIESRGLDRELLMNPALKDHSPDGDYMLLPIPSEAVVRNSAGTVLIYERWPEGQSPPAGIGAAFADGHCERVPVDLFMQILRESQKLAKPQD